MTRTTHALIALALCASLGGCDRPEVTTSETAPRSIPNPDFSGMPGSTPMSAPVALPESVLGVREAISEEENVKFEKWCKRFNLDSSDPAMLDADSDRDGFNNREEYVAATNPLDATSVPGMLDGVVMKEMKEVQVPVILREVKGGKAKVQRLDTAGTEEWEQGTVVNGLPYRVTGVKQDVKADKHGVFSDVSKVTIENRETKEMLTLIRDLPTRSSETHAVITGPGGTEQKIRVDEIIEIPGQRDKQFKVLEIRPEQVVIEEMGTRRPLTIPKR